MTVLMPNWYYEKKDLKRTPSVVDGIDAEKENRYRREGARFIINVGTKMGLRYDTMATGVVYFHRFYMFHSFKTFPRYVTACCCLFLAGKVEETPKKCKDIIRTAKGFLGENQFSQFGDDPGEEVMTLERILLQTIKFDLQVDHPYGYLLKYAKSLKGDNKKLQNMVQMAWTFINDSLCTTLCLQWEPEVIAIALMYLAGKLSKFEVLDWTERLPKHSHWWDMFVEGMSIELLEDICHQVLDLYSTPMSNTPQDSPPATPPTKSTRKTSQPPSPVEAPSSPAPQAKVKEPPVGLPIPRLEPGELKRKIPVEPKKEVESKIPRIEGKAIPTISSATSPPPPLKKINRIKGTSTQPSSPSSPNVIETVSKAPKHVDALPKRNTLSDATFRSGISSVTNTQSLPTNPSALSTDTAALVKPPQHVPVIPTTTFTLPLPPPTATYTQAAPPFYTTGATGETSSFPNIQQPPPQIFPQQPLQFQHPPPSVAPSTPITGLPPHQYSEPPHQFTGLPPGAVPPPFNAQYPPPIRPPNVMNNPPPTLAPGLTHHPPPPMSGLLRNPQPPPPPGVTPRSSPAPPPPGISPSPRNSRPSMAGGPRNSGPRMGSDNVFNSRPGSDMYRPRQEGRVVRPPLLDQVLPMRDFDTRSSFGDSPRFKRPNPEFDPHFQPNPPFPEFDQSFHRPMHPNQFGPNFARPMGPRRFPPDLQHRNRGPPSHRNPGPRPRMMNNMQQQQQGTSTGIPPVRITGSN